MSTKPSHDTIDAALLRFNEETVLYCGGISDAAPHNYAMHYSRMLRNRAKGLEGEQIEVPGDLFEPNRELIEATLEEMYRKYFATRGAGGLLKEKVKLGADASTTSGPVGRKAAGDEYPPPINARVEAPHGTSLKGSIKKHSDEPLKAKVDPEPLNIPGKPYVRYVGFGSIEGGRRLRFAVKSNVQKSVEVTIEVSHTSFTRASGISIQDAAPMAYEKIVELLAMEGAIESNELCLTDADIAQYITRHLSSEKRHI